jgi:hypothetical protein
MADRQARWARCQRVPFRLHVFLPPALRRLDGEDADGVSPSMTRLAASSFFASQEAGEYVGQCPNRGSVALLPGRVIQWGKYFPDH